MKNRNRFFLLILLFFVVLGGCSGDDDDNDNQSADDDTASDDDNLDDDDDDNDSSPPVNDDDDDTDDQTPDWLFFEDFESYPVLQPPPDPWNVSVTGNAQALVWEWLEGEESQVLLIEDMETEGGGGVTTLLREILPQQSSYHVEWDWIWPHPVNASGMSFQLRTANAETAVAVNFWEGSVQALSGASEGNWNICVPASLFPANEWLHLDLEIDPSAATYSLTINGELTPCRDLPFAVFSSPLVELAAVAYKNATGGQMLFDNIGVLGVPDSGDDDDDDEDIYWIFFDDFEDDPLHGFPDEPWIKGIWNENVRFRIMTNEKDGQGQMLEMEDVSEEGEGTLYTLLAHSLVNNEPFVVVWDFYWFNISQSQCLGMQTRDEEGHKVTAVDFCYDRIEAVSNEGGEDLDWITCVPEAYFDRGVWYHMEMVIDPLSSTYDVRVNDQETLCNDLHLADGETTIDDFAFVLYLAPTGGRAFVDNVGIGIIEQ